jgi:hypothetical protein
LGGKKQEAGVEGWGQKTRNGIESWGQKNKGGLRTIDQQVAEILSYLRYLFFS